MRLIDADALMALIETQRERAKTALEDDLEAMRATDGLFLAIKALILTEPTVEVSEPQRWIPVDERLPDITEHYTSDPCIVFCDNGAYGFAELEENIFGQVGWNCERDDEYHEPLGTVIAWMPLPEPYKEEA